MDRSVPYIKHGRLYVGAIHESPEYVDSTANPLYSVYIICFDLKICCFCVEFWVYIDIIFDKCIVCMYNVM